MGLPGLEVFPDCLNRPNKSSRQKPKSEFRTLVGEDPVFTTGGVGRGKTRGSLDPLSLNFKKSDLAFCDKNTP